NEVVAPPGLRDRKEELVLDLQRPPVNGGDVRRGGRTGDAEVALDQVLSEGGGVRRATTGAGEDHDRRLAFEAGEQPCHRRGQDSRLRAVDGWGVLGIISQPG